MGNASLNFRAMSELARRVIPQAIKNRIRFLTPAVNEDWIYVTCGFTATTGLTYTIHFEVESRVDSRLGNVFDVSVSTHHSLFGYDAIQQWIVGRLNRENDLDGAWEVKNRQYVSYNCVAADEPTLKAAFETCLTAMDRLAQAVVAAEHKLHTDFSSQ